MMKKKQTLQSLNSHTQLCTNTFVCHGWTSTGPQLELKLFKRVGEEKKCLKQKVNQTTIL